MRRILLSVVAAASMAACGQLGNLTTITLGDGELPEFPLDREYAIGQQDLSQCPEGQRTVTDDRTQDEMVLNITKTTGGCRLSFREPSMLLFSEEDARQVSNKLQGRDIQGLKSAAVTIKSFSLTDEAGAAFDVETRLTALTVSIDGQELFTREDILALSNGPVRKEISGALLQKLVDGVNNGQAVRADVDANLEVPDAGLADLPAELHLNAVLQPEVSLDLVEALGG